MRNERRVFPEFPDKKSEKNFFKELHFWGIPAHNRKKQEYYQTKWGPDRTDPDFGKPPGFGAQGFGGPGLGGPGLGGPSLGGPSLSPNMFGKEPQVKMPWDPDQTMQQKSPHVVKSKRPLYMQNDPDPREQYSRYDEPSYMRPST